jgi:hypothetical protein
LSTTFALPPLAKTPTWITPGVVVVSKGGALYLRLDANDAGSYKLASGSLPGGVVLSNDGLLSGVCGTAGMYEVVVRAVGSSKTVYADHSLTISVNDPLPMTSNATFESLKASGRVSGYDLREFRFYPRNDAFEFVCADRTANSLQPWFSAELKFAAHSTDGAYATYVIEALHGSTKDGVALSTSTQSGTATIPLNTTMYGWWRIEKNLITHKVYSGFAPSTWTLSGEVFSRTYAVTIDAGDIALENTHFVPDGSGSLQGVWTANEPSLVTTNYRRGMSGSGSNRFMSNAGEVWGCGSNASGQITGVAGSSMNTLIKVPGLPFMTRFSDTPHSDFMYGRDGNGDWWRWGPYSAHGLGDGGSGLPGIMPPTKFTLLPGMTRVVQRGMDTWAKVKNGDWYRWGPNESSCLATGDSVPLTVPTLYTGLSNIKDVVNDPQGFFFLLHDGSLYYVGGQWKSGPTITTPTLVMTGVARVLGGWIVYMYKHDGTWWLCGYSSTGGAGTGGVGSSWRQTSPTQITTLPKPLRSIVSWYDTIATHAAGTPVIGYGLVLRWQATGPGYPWQSGGVAVAGLPTNVQYSMIGSCSTMITWDRKLYTAGYNSNYEAGFNTLTQRDTTQLVPPFTMCADALTPTWNTARVDLAIGAVSVMMDASEGRYYQILAGSLPAGLSMNSEGVVTGTTTAAATTTAVIRAYGITGCRSDAAVAFKVTSAPVTWTTGTLLAPFTAGSAYSFSLQAANATTYTLVGGALPVGLVLSASGVISGTTATKEVATFHVRAANSDMSQDRVFKMSHAVVSDMVAFNTASPAGEYLVQLADRRVVPGYWDGAWMKIHDESNNAGAKYASMWSPADMTDGSTHGRTSGAVLARITFTSSLPLNSVVRYTCQYIAHNSWDGEGANVNDGTVNLFTANPRHNNAANNFNANGSASTASGNTIFVDAVLGNKTTLVLHHNNALDQDSADESMLIRNAAVYVKPNTPPPVWDTNAWENFAVVFWGFNSNGVHDYKCSGATSFQLLTSLPAGITLNGSRIQGVCTAPKGDYPAPTIRAINSGGYTDRTMGPITVR